MDQTETREWEVLAATLRRTFAENLSAALLVAGTTQGCDGISKMNLTDLNRRTDISRSTLSKLTNGETASGIQANPDLETICRLATVLNLPPAFLLMSKNDWQLMIGAMKGLSQALEGSLLDNLIQKEKNSNKVKIGLILAKNLGIYSEKRHLNELDKELSERQININSNIDNENDMKMLAILTTTAVTQGAAKNRGDLPILTAIGAIIGSHFNKSNKLE